ncbi:Icl1f [Symbiodinium necroappetens]|uniref:Icl1f protein n=1 Tax=Symbiodinium necroappetens TaxID=1628268 RepID=A0A812LI62_9DINO|nr:Icl1f [Symbiodinium necroappetens]CAE7277137.1 Icl1f [Symbiodinium sp. KB8]CAE7348545.1 Icl1f [Symbiodinium microadriaticum]
MPDAQQSLQPASSFRARRGGRVELSTEDDLEDLLAKVDDTVPEFDPQEYIRPGVTEAEILEMKGAFDLLDVEGKGRLNLEEAIDNLENLGWDRLEQEPLMVAIRACRRKAPKTDFAGFMDAIGPLLAATEPTQESLRRAWRLLDENRKGHIDMEDLSRVVHSFGLELSVEELRDMVSFCDKNGSSEITFDEFYQMLSRHQ